MARYHLKLTPQAKADLLDILKYSKKMHGDVTARAYDALIKNAFRHLQEEPYRAGSKDRKEIAEGIRSYRIELAKIAASPKIKKPRHLIFYFTPDQDRLVVSRILHDAQDYTRTMSEMRDHVMEHAATPPKPSHKRERER